MEDKNLQERIEENEYFTLGEKEFIIKCIDTYEFVQKLTMKDLLNIIPIREELGLPSSPTLEITIDDTNQILQWWGLSDSFHGDELAKRLEEFVTSNQSLETKEERRT